MTPEVKYGSREVTPQDGMDIAIKRSARLQLARRSWIASRTTVIAQGREGTGRTGSTIDAVYFPETGFASVVAIQPSGK